MSTLLTKYNPMDSLFREFWPHSPGFAEESKTLTLRPRVDILENDAAFLVTMDLPGVSKKDLMISVENGVLTVKASRESESHDEYDTVRRERHAASTFTRSFSLSDQVDADKIKGKLHDGVLTLTVPKAARAVARKIEVD